MRLIDAEPLENSLYIMSKASQRYWEDTLREVSAMVRSQPTVDVTILKHGQWLDNPNGHVPYCSVCKEEPSNYKTTPYCPYCGAKMEITNGN